jgi:biopolymer transport protein ExbD
MIHFPRTAKPFRGHLDLSALLCVLAPLGFAFSFHQFLVLPRGARLELPVGDAGPTVNAGERLLIVAVDANEQLYFENQVIGREALANALKQRAAGPFGPQTLLIQADRRVRLQQLADLAGLARITGVRSVIFGALPARTP